MTSVVALMAPPHCLFFLHPGEKGGENHCNNNLPVHQCQGQGQPGCTHQKVFTGPH